MQPASNSLCGGLEDAELFLVQDLDLQCCPGSALVTCPVLARLVHLAHHLIKLGARADLGALEEHMSQQRSCKKQSERDPKCCTFEADQGGGRMSGDLPAPPSFRSQDAHKPSPVRIKVKELQVCVKT